MNTVFKENYLTISWSNFSSIGSGAADLELKRYILNFPRFSFQESKN